LVLLFDPPTPEIAENSTITSIDLLNDGPRVTSVAEKKREEDVEWTAEENLTFSNTRYELQGILFFHHAHFWVEVKNPLLNGCLFFLIFFFKKKKKERKKKKKKTTYLV